MPTAVRGSTRSRPRSSTVGCTRSSCADRRRRPISAGIRFALHSWPLPFSDDGFDDEEVALTGRAVPVDDADLVERVARAVGDAAASGLVFELAIETAFHKHRRGGLSHDVWRGDRADG